MPAAPALRLVLRARSKVSRAEPSLRSSLTEASGSPAVPQQPGEEGTVSMSITIIRDGASQQQVIDATTTGLDLFGATCSATPCSELGGRYWVRTSDLFGVNEARYHCANRPVSSVDNPIPCLPHPP